HVQHPLLRRLLCAGTRGLPGGMEEERVNTGAGNWKARKGWPAAPSPAWRSGGRASAANTWMHFDRRSVYGLVLRGYLTSRRDERVSMNSPFTWQYRITAMGRRALRILDGEGVE